MPEITPGSGIAIAAICLTVIGLFITILTFYFKYFPPKLKEIPTKMDDYGPKFVTLINIVEQLGRDLDDVTEDIEKAHREQKEIKLAVNETNRIVIVLESIMREIRDILKKLE